jgi:hypothetical protein
MVAMIICCSVTAIAFRKPITFKAAKLSRPVEVGWWGRKCRQWWLEVNCDTSIQLVILTRLCNRV